MESYRTYNVSVRRNDGSVIKKIIDARKKEIVGLAVSKGTRFKISKRN